MTIPLLATKLFIPPPRPGLLARPRLVAKLNQGTAYPLTLVSASAGSGKTTLLSEWAAQSDRPLAWLSLDAGDDNLAHFLAYFIAALRSRHPEFGAGTLESLGASQDPPFDLLRVQLINELAQLPAPLSLVLDDYHALSDGRIHAWMAALLEHLPPQLRLVVASRMDPPWPLARYRARNQLCEVRGRDLRFNPDEVTRFLHDSMGLVLSGGEVAALEARTEGWIAGLQLAGLSMQGRSDLSAFVQAFTGSHLYVAEYLVSEILEQQPEAMRTFLLRTAILERLCAELCEAVSGCPDGSAMLADLQRLNLFLVPLDPEGRWFRYHHLFADLLRARLQQQASRQEIAGLHTHAARWHAAQGSLPEAVRHAFAGGDGDLAASLVDRAGLTLVFSDPHNTLAPWLEALPAEAFHTHPRLEIYRFLIELSRGTLDMYEATLLEKEALIRALPPSPENQHLTRQALLNLALFFAHQNTAHAIQIAQEALRQIPEQDAYRRAALYSAFYRAYGMEGEIAKSAPAYRECFLLGMASGQYHLVANTTMVRAFDLCQYGRLDEAAGYCRQVLQAGAAVDQKVFYPAGPAYIGLAGICLERGQLEEAGGYLDQGLDLCRQGAVYGLYTATILKSRLHLAQGALEQSRQALALVEHTLQRRDFTLTAQQVALGLACGDHDTLSRLVPGLLEILGGSSYARVLPLIAAEAFKLCLARIYLFQGKIEETHTLLDEIQPTLEAGERLGRLLEVHLLRALALQNQAGGSRPAQAALDSLSLAVALAQGPGYVGLLREAGPDLLPLLHGLAARPGEPAGIRAYARKLLVAFGQVPESAGSRQRGSDAGLVEALTPREMEVLALLADGDSNQHIADKLCITVRTVKKHTSNIYGKLDAASRTQAVAIARQAGLLPAD